MSARRRPPNGSHASKPGDCGSGADPKHVDRQLQDLLERVFDRAQTGLRDELGEDDYERHRRDFVFHMLDWESDLRRMVALVDEPGKVSSKEATTFIIGFLYHVIPHLNAAGNLLLDEVPDPFAPKIRGDS